MPHNRPFAVLPRRFLPASILVALIAGCTYLAAGWNIRSSADEIIKSAEASLQKQRSEDVRSQLKWLLWFEPENTDALFLQGASLFLDEDYDEAVSCLLRVPRSSSSYGKAGLALASAYLRTGLLTAAESTLESLVETMPQSDQARQALIELYMNQFRQREAVALLESRLEVFPDDLSVVRGLLMLDTETLTADKRIILLEKANRQEPDQPAVILAIANANVQLGHAGEAERCFEIALRMRPDHVVTCLQAAAFHFATGQTDLADSLIQGLELNKVSGDDRFWALKSQSQQRLGNHDAALASIDSAIRIRPFETDYLNRKAGILRRMKRIADAEKASLSAQQTGQARNQLFLASNRPELDQPTRDFCEEVASLYVELNRPDRARLWRRLIQFVDR